MSAVPEGVLPAQGVVIAVDPHKASGTAVAVTAGLAPAGSVRGGCLKRYLVRQLYPLLCGILQNKQATATAYTRL